MALTIPDGLHYAATMEFGGDLLLWSEDAHRQQKYLELCLVELDDGTVIAQRDVPITGYVYPQCIGDRLFLCDGEGGKVMALDKTLNQVDAWEMEPTEESMYMTAEGILYRFTSKNRLVRHDWTDGTGEPVLEGDPYIDWINGSGDVLTICYHLPENGRKAYCGLDLLTGEICYTDADDEVDSVSRKGDTWLHEKYGAQVHPSA